MSSPITAAEMNTYISLTRANFRWVELNGRNVMLIPIKDFAYLPIDVNDFKGHEEWVLVIEEDGNTWIWDSWINEG